MLCNLHAAFQAGSGDDWIAPHLTQKVYKSDLYDGVPNLVLSNIYISGDVVISAINMLTGPKDQPQPKVVCRFYLESISAKGS